MLRLLFLLLLLIHGLIHLMGFVSNWHLANFSQMTGKTLMPISPGMTKALGVCWLIACMGYVAAAIGYGFRRDWWLPMATVSLVLSQLLILLYWADAKAGTLANMLIALIVGVTYAQLRFDRQANQEARQLLSRSVVDKSIVTLDMLAGLPNPVQQWLIRSGVVGREKIHTVRLRQHGQMRTKPDGSWMPTEAEQYFTVDEPGFVWKADVSMWSFLPLAGRDRYANGKGTMLIKALAIVPIVDASDAYTNQGTLLRYLGELCWFPSAALSPYLTWKPIDETHAEATMTYKGVSASAVYTFDGQNRLAGITAKRYKGDGKASTLETWYIPLHDWKRINGITIPVRGDVIWKLRTGDFDYYQWEIAEIDYNKTALYE